jgi:hypothetical protein
LPARSARPSCGRISNEELSAPAGGQPFLTGRVTFCNMVPMRSVPSRVICLLGMNDTDYPRRQETISFDRMAVNPMPGDRNRRHDDLYLFLEALLSARNVLYVSWIGRDQQDNSLRQPSVAGVRTHRIYTAGLPVPFRRGGPAQDCGTSPAAFQPPLF